MADDGLAPARDERVRVAAPQLGRLGGGGADRHVAVAEVVRGGEVGDDVGDDAALDQLLEQLDGVRVDGDRERPPRRRCLPRPADRLSEVAGRAIDIAVAAAALELLGVHLGAEEHAAEDGDRERLRRAHPAEPGRDAEPPGERAAEVLACNRGERLVGALDHALRADVLPRGGGEPAPDREPRVLQLVEALGCLVAADEDPGRHHDRRCERMGREDGDRLAGLDRERLPVPQRAQRGDDPLVALPVAGGLRVPRVDDEVILALGQLERVLEQAQDRLLAPAAAAQVAPACSPDARRTLRHAPAPGRRSRTGRTRHAPAPRRHGRRGRPSRRARARPHAAAQLAAGIRAPPGGRDERLRIDDPALVGVEQRRGRRRRPVAARPSRGQSPKRRAGASAITWARSASGSPRARNASWSSGSSSSSPGAPEESAKTSSPCLRSAGQPTWSEETIRSSPPSSARQSASTSAAAGAAAG